MSRRRKLEKFEEILHFDHVFEMTEPGSKELKRGPEEIVQLNGDWREKVFKNNNPLCLELACGRGEYCIGLAKKYPKNNYLGVDIKGARIWKGASFVKEQQILNVAFLRIRIEYLHCYFDTHELDEIWITFPDPFHGKANRRIVHPRNIANIKSLLKPGGLLHLKTDDPDYYAYAKEVLSTDPSFQLEKSFSDIYKESQDPNLIEIQTYYEKQHLLNGRTIKYLFFSKNY